MDYAEAEHIMNMHRANVQRGTGVIASKKPHMKKLGNRTWLERQDPGNDAGISYGLRLFGQEVITYSRDYVTINDRGFFSRTTHDRFNEYLPRGFRVHGHTPTFLKPRRPLGFISTPIGVYPYCMPINFTYGGAAYGVQLTSAADKAVAMLPAAVDHYLDCLFKNTKEDFVTFTLAEANTAWLSRNGSEQGIGHTSRAAAYRVMSGLKDAHLVTLAADHARDSMATRTNELPSNEVLNVLIEDGVAAFRRTRSDVDRARRLERVIQHNLPMPVLHSGTLRNRLRGHIIEYIIWRLGFDTVEWNRR